MTLNTKLRFWTHSFGELGAIGDGPSLMCEQWDFKKMKLAAELDQKWFRCTRTGQPAVVSWARYNWACEPGDRGAPGASAGGFCGRWGLGEGVWALEMESWTKEGSSKISLLQPIPKKRGPGCRQIPEELLWGVSARIWGTGCSVIRKETPPATYREDSSCKVAVTDTWGALSPKENTKLKYSWMWKWTPILNEKRNYNQLQLLNNQHRMIQKNNIFLPTWLAWIMIFFSQGFLAVHSQCPSNLSTTLWYHFLQNEKRSVSLWCSLVKQN